MVKIIEWDKHSHNMGCDTRSVGHYGTDAEALRGMRPVQHCSAVPVMQFADSRCASAEILVS